MYISFIPRSIPIILLDIGFFSGVNTQDKETKYLPDLSLDMVIAFGWLDGGLCHLTFKGVLHFAMYTRGSWKCKFSASDYKFLAKAVFRRFSVD